MRAHERTQSRSRGARRAEERRVRTRDELAELDARYTRVAAAAALAAVRRSARAARRSA